MSDAGVKMDKMKTRHLRPIDCLLKVFNNVDFYLMCLTCALKGDHRNVTHIVGM